MEGTHEFAENFLQSGADVFCVIAPDGHFKYVNDAGPNILKRSKEDFGKTVYELLHKDDVSRVRGLLEKAAGGEPQSFDGRFTCGGPECRWMSWDVFGLHGDVYALLRDVTHIHDERETLQIAQNRLRLLHQATSDPTESLAQKMERVLNLGNKQLRMKIALVTQMDDNAYTVIRAKSDGIDVQVGKTYDAKQTFDSITAQAGNLIGIHNVGRSVYSEHPAHIAMRLESYIAIPIYIDGKIFGVLSFSSDEPYEKQFNITDFDFVRLIAQWMSSSIALLIANESIAYNAAIVSSSEDAIIGQSKDGLITTWNKGAEILFQYTEKEIVGKHFSIIIPDTAKEEIDTILAKLLKGERVEHYDTLRKKKDGTLVDVSVTVSPIINEEGAIVGASSVMRDITREKQIDRAKTEFVSLASHQLRTPLSAINWYAELLRDGEAGKLTKQQQEFVDEIFQGNQRMIKLVNELLNVSRVDFGNFTIEPVDTDILDISRSVVKELRPGIMKKKLNVSEDYEGETLSYKADPNILRIVIQNLVSNAVKYTPDRGKITIKIATDKKAGKLIIVVSDTGYGIPKSQQNQIFTKLFRADNVQEMDTVGTGLGLYVLKSIVEESGGDVSFVSAENEGTTFTVTLPLSGMKKKVGGKSLSQVTP